MCKAAGRETTNKDHQIQSLRKSEVYDYWFFYECLGERTKDKLLLTSSSSHNLDSKYTSGSKSLTLQMTRHTV